MVGGAEAGPSPPPDHRLRRSPGRLSDQASARSVALVPDVRSESQRVPGFRAADDSSDVSIRDVPSILLTMCNDYEQQIAWAEYCKMMQMLELGIPTQQSELDLRKADNIRINDIGPVMRTAGNGVELVPMTFGFPPSGPRGGPVFNFRSEGRRFDKSNRCLIPASAFFEFTGKRYPKTKHRFTLVDAPFMAIAGLWRDTKGDNAPAFTMLTTEPGEEVKPYHNRQVVVLRPEDWASWLYLTTPEAELLRPLPKGSLHVETVRQGSD